MSSQHNRLAKGGQGSNGPHLLSPNSAPFTRTIIPRPDGTTATQLGIDTTSLLPPDRRYSADSASVRFNGTDAVFLTFVQQAVTGTPRSIVAVKLYSDSAKRFLETCRPVMPALDKFTESHGIAVPQLNELSAEPAQSVSLVASFAQTAFAGYEAEMSFFHVSPFAIHRAGQGQMSHIHVEPVVQIDMATATLTAVLRRLDEVAPKLRVDEE